MKLILLNYKNKFNPAKKRKKKQKIERTALDPQSTSRLSVYRLKKMASCFSEDKFYRWDKYRGRSYCRAKMTGNITVKI